MAETLLSFGVKRLWNLLVQESKRFQGVKDQFDELKSDLQRLRCFLEDAETKKHTSAVVRNNMKEIKEIVYDAEDIIETFLLEEELGKTNDIKRRIRKLVCVIADRRGLAFEMEALSKRITMVIPDRQGLGLQQFIFSERDTQSLEERQREMRQTFSSDNEEHLVGLEKNIEQLVGYLVEEASNQVVSIIGMGGIGKTTLARQVFNHEMVQNHFDGSAWVCISQQFATKCVWQTILHKLSSKDDEQKISNMTKDELQDKLFRLLQTSSSLIVLDDMWKQEDWDRIKPIFPSMKGWKVLLTSRHEYVALHADPTCVILKPECLTFEESWTLFQRIAFPRNDTPVDGEMEDMGMQMIKHCGGLPLAVKALGGLLAAQHTLSEWKRLYENIGSRINGGTSITEKKINSVNHILSLSFEELPMYLKHCFLYFAHFPEDYTINVGNLAYCWAAEGIPRPTYYDGATILEVAYVYIEELVKRSMIISERDAKTSRFEACHMHDVMREVCLLKAEEENFVHIVDKSASTPTSQSPCESRRIAVHRSETYIPTLEMQNPKLRSLLIINLPFVTTSIGIRFTRLQLIRVLDLSCAKFEGGKLPSGIGTLIHLRYLSLYWVEVTHLPSSMRNLKMLLYLNLDVYSRSALYMAPNFLKEMRELRYLYLPCKLNDKVKLELGNLVNLETLENFSTKHSSVRDLDCMARLEILSITFDDKGCNMETLSSSLRKLRKLESLTILGRKVSNGEGFVLDCGSRLKHMYLGIYMPKLPDEQHFPSRLTSLHLEWCCLVEDPMPVLEKLIHLKMVNLMGRSFAGRRMVCSSGGFPQLHNLSIWGLHEWGEWIVEEGSIPVLHTLKIENCPKLKQLPVSRFPQLQKLELNGSMELEEWIVKEGFMPLVHSLRIR